MPQPLYQNINIPQGLQAVIKENIVRLYNIINLTEYNIFVTEVIGIIGDTTGSIISVNAAPMLTAQDSNNAGSIVYLTFDKNMSDPAGTEAEFVVTVNGSPVTISSVALNGNPKVIDLNVTPAFAADAVLTVKYTKGTITAQDATVLQSFGPIGVTNRSTNISAPRLTVPDLPTISVSLSVLAPTPVTITPPTLTVPDLPSITETAVAT